MASIPACHAGDQGSIPCDGDFFLELLDGLVFCIFHRSQPFDIGLEFGMQIYLDPLFYLLVIWYPI